MDGAVDAVTCIIYLKLNLTCFALLPLQAAPLAGGGNSEPYRPMTSSCTTLTRTTGTRPGWMPGGDSKTLGGSYCDSRKNTIITIKTQFFLSSSCAGTPAGDDQLQHLGRSLVRLRVYRAATPSSTVPPAWRHSAWTVRGETSVQFVCINRTEHAASWCVEPDEHQHCEGRSSLIILFLVTVKRAATIHS